MTRERIFPQQGIVNNFPQALGRGIERGLENPITQIGLNLLSSRSPGTTLSQQLNRGVQTAQNLRQTRLERESALQQLANQNRINELAPKAFQGDQNALAQIAAIDPSVAIQIQKEARLGRQEALEAQLAPLRVQADLAKLQSQPIIQQAKAIEAERKIRGELKPIEVDRQIDNFNDNLKDTKLLDFVLNVNKLSGVINLDENIPGVGEVEGRIPGIFTSSEGLRVRNLKSELENVILNALSGAAISPDEATRLIRALGDNTERGFKEFLRDFNEVAIDKLKQFETSLNPQSLAELRKRGGINSDTITRKFLRQDARERLGKKTERGFNFSEDPDIRLLQQLARDGDVEAAEQLQILTKEGLIQ